MMTLAFIGLGVAVAGAPLWATIGLLGWRLAFDPEVSMNVFPLLRPSSE